MRGDPYWLTAKWAGTCVRCGAHIKRGDKAYYYPRDRALYCASDSCGEKASREFAAYKQDEECGA
jgi:hypothetical protein